MYDLPVCMGGHKYVVQYLVEMANCDISEYNSYIYSIPETQYVFTSAHLIRHNPVGSDSVWLWWMCLYMQMWGRNTTGQSLQDPDNEGCVDVALYTWWGWAVVVVVMSTKTALLCEACRSGKLDVAKELVEQHKVDPNEWVSSVYSPILPQLIVLIIVLCLLHR